MSNLMKQRQDLRGRSIFPDTQTSAEFHFRSQTITLETIDRSQFENSNDPKAFANSRSVTTIIFHELTHWADLVGTVWGRRFMREIYEVLPLLQRLNTGGAETEFWRMVSLHDLSRRLFFLAYYRVQEGSGELGSPHESRVDFSGGIEFDSTGRPDSQRPILFVRFYGRSGSLFIRQPLTVGSLIEATAVWSELSTSSEIISTLDVVEARIEQTQSDAEMTKLLNSPELTLYTACARMTAHFSKIDNYYLAYKLAASLSFLCLNLQRTHFNALQPPEIMNVWGKRNNASKTNLDPAYAFAAICINAGNYLGSESVEDWIDRGLKKCTLPPSQEIREEAIIGMEREPPLKQSNLSETGQYLLDAGLKIAIARAERTDPALTLRQAIQRKLPLPPIFAQLDVVKFPFSTFDYTKFDPETMFKLEWELDKATDNFLSSCR